jgi:HK97 family phage major capsid protein
VFYANNSTIYSRLVGMVDTTGRPIFQPNAQAGAEGTLVGFPVKREDGIQNDKILIGYPKTVVGNIIQDIMVETDRDIKKHVITYAGYARAEFKLVADAAFALLTVSPS